MQTAYSVDELRVLARAAGAAVPPLMTAGWSDDDLPTADVVAARSLLARGAVQLVDVGRSPVLRPVAATTAVLAPLRRPSAVVEVVRVDETGQEHRHVLVDGGTGGCRVEAGSLHLAEREPDVWTLRRAGEASESLAWAVAAEMLDDGDRPAGTGRRFRVTAGALARCEAAWSAGAPDRGAGLLRAAGVAGTLADAWTAVLDTRRGTWTVRACRRLDGAGEETYDIGELRWVDGGDAGVWRVQPVDDLDEAPAPGHDEHDEDDDADEPADTVQVTDVGLPAIRDALDALLSGRDDEPTGAGRTEGSIRG